jgi:preprotein translocase subunit SecE
MAKIVSYISESFEELKSNMTWPVWAEVQRLTIVAIFSIIIRCSNMGIR